MQLALKIKFVFVLRKNLMSFDDLLASFLLCSSFSALAGLRDAGPSHYTHLPAGYDGDPHAPKRRLSSDGEREKSQAELEESFAN